MKKLLVALLVVFCGLPCLAQTLKPVYVDGVNVYTKSKIYANSFDGYLNMRTAPSTSAKIVGAFRNGEMPGYVIKQEGNWVKIYYQGVIGYVYKKNTSSSPTVAVTVDVDTDWLQGVWIDEEMGYDVYMFFGNGTYELRTVGYDIEMGTYRFAGKSVVLTPFVYKGRTWEETGETVHVTVYEDKIAEYCEPRSFDIDLENDVLGYYTRGEFVRPTEAEDGTCVTYEEFNEEKAAVKALLGK